MRSRPCSTGTSTGSTRMPSDVSGRLSPTRSRPRPSPARSTGAAATTGRARMPACARCRSPSSRPRSRASARALGSFAIRTAPHVRAAGECSFRSPASRRWGAVLALVNVGVRGDGKASASPVLRKAAATARAQAWPTTLKRPVPLHEVDHCAPCRDRDRAGRPKDRGDRPRAGRRPRSVLVCGGDARRLDPGRRPRARPGRSVDRTTSGASLARRSGCGPSSRARPRPIGRPS